MFALFFSLHEIIIDRQQSVSYTPCMNKNTPLCVAMALPPACGSVSQAKPSVILWLALAAVLALGWHVQAMGQEAQAGEANKPAGSAQPVSGIVGLWVWRTTDYESKAAREELIDFSKKWGYNRLLVQVHRQRTGDRNALLLPEAYADLIARAADAGIAVEALDGGPQMGYAENHEKTLAQLDVILAFNNTLPQGKRLVGIHYDIEPYIHADFKGEQSARDTIMQDLLVFYDKAKARLAQDGNGLTLASDIPFWYDNRTAPDNHCMVTHNGQRKNLHQHIQDICDYTGVMSYRRHAQGSNSVMTLIENELNYARSIGKPIAAALETIELKEAKQISFHGQPPADYINTRSELLSLLKDDPAFAGVLTHSYTGAKELLKDATPETLQAKTE